MEHEKHENVPLCALKYAPKDAGTFGGTWALTDMANLIHISWGEAFNPTKRLQQAPKPQLLHFLQQLNCTVHAAPHLCHQNNGMRRYWSEATKRMG
jgi:hypothetical protein